MLARTFKTAAELGIPEHEQAALVTVLYMIEDGQIPMGRINMYSYHTTHYHTTHPGCGTQHCLAGWANVIDNKAFPETSPLSLLNLAPRIPQELSHLFGLTTTERARQMRDATPEQATAALRTYLETGTCPSP